MAGPGRRGSTGVSLSSSSGCCLPASLPPLCAKNTEAEGWHMGSCHSCTWLVLSHGVVHSNNLIPSRYSTTEAPSQVCRNSQVWAWSPSWAQYLNNSIGSRESTSRKIVCGVSLWTQGLCFLKVTPLPPPTHLEMTEQGAKDVV